MLKSLIHGKLKSVERELGAPVDYLHHMVDTSLGAFFKFAKIMPMASYRKVLPVEVYHVAGMVSSRHADCGTCLQIAVNLARKDGLAEPIIRAILDRDPAALREELSDVYHFAEKVVSATYDETAFRDAIRNRYGEKGIVELALVIGSAQVFPLVKRTMGYAVSCQDVKIADASTVSDS
jgi:hypothetical protein